MNAADWKAAVYNAAMGHAKKAPSLDQRRAYVLYYVAAVVRDLKAKRQYTLAYWTQDLMSEMKATTTLQSLRGKYPPNRNENPQETPALRADPTPAGNTGVTPQQLDILREYV